MGYFVVGSRDVTVVIVVVSEKLKIEKINGQK